MIKTAMNNYPFPAMCLASLYVVFLQFDYLDGFHLLTYLRSSVSYPARFPGIRMSVSDPRPAPKFPNPTAW